MKITRNELRGLIKEELARMAEGDFPEEKYGMSDLPFGQEPGPQMGGSRFPQGRGFAEQQSAYDEAAVRYGKVWRKLTHAAEALFRDDKAWSAISQDSPDVPPLMAYIQMRMPGLYDALLDMAEGDEDLLFSDLEIIFDEIQDEMTREDMEAESYEEEVKTRRGDYGGFIP